MPEPVTVLLGGLALLLFIGLVSYSRFTRLRAHIDDSAAAVAAQRERWDRLMTDLEQTLAGHPAGDPSGGPSDAARVAEQVAEAEDRLEAVNRLHSAQVRAWNRLGRERYWWLLRGVTGWKPLPEPPGTRGARSRHARAARPSAAGPRARGRGQGPAGTREHRPGGREHPTPSGRDRQPANGHEHQADRFAERPSDDRD